MESGYTTHLTRVFAAMATAGALSFGTMAGAQAMADEQSLIWAQDAPQSIALDQIAQANLQDGAARIGTSTPTLTVPKQDIVRGVHFDPLMPIPLIAGFALLYGALGVYPFRRRIKGAFLRAGAGATLTALMLNPVISTEQRENLPTEALIIIDQSASQRLDNRAFETTEIYAQIQEQIASMPNVNIRIVEVGASETQDGQRVDGTQLYRAATQVLTEIPRDQLGAVFVITDGVIDDVPSERFGLIEDDIPTHFLVTGHETEFDRRVEIISAPQFGMLESSQNVQLRVSDDGAYTVNEPVTVTVSSQGEVIGEYETRLDDVLQVTIDLGLTGANVFDFSVATLEGELTNVNNTTSIEVTGIREDLNVLMLSGEPSQSGRYLRSIFRSDPSANLVHLNTLRPPGKPQTVPLGEVSLIPIPVNEILVENINDFDLIVLDRYRMSGILNYEHFANIRRFVEGGGALLLINDDEFLSSYESIATSPDMREIFPIEIDERLGNERGAFLPDVSEQGQRHPIMRDVDQAQGEDDPNWGRWLTRISADAKDNANVLLETENGDPLLIVNRVEQGRVAMVMSDNFWLWANGYDGGGPAEELLQNLSHWLMAYPELEEENVSLALSADGQRLIVTRQTLGDDVQGPVRLTTPTGEEIDVTVTQIDDGLYRGEVNVSDLGLYRVEQARDARADIDSADELQPLSDFLSVGSINPSEFEYTLSTTEYVQPYLTTNLGSVSRVVERDMESGMSTVILPSVTLHPANMTAENFINTENLGVRETDSFVLRSAENDPLIPPWLGMLGALSLFAGAWYREGGGKNPLRRRKGQSEVKAPSPS